MAPRPPESLEAFLVRLDEDTRAGKTVIPFGRYHYRHAVCLEDGMFPVRMLEHTREEAEAFLREHGMFMPEHSEQISRPQTLVFEASNADELASWLAENWPS